MSAGLQACALADWVWCAATGAALVLAGLGLLLLPLDLVGVFGALYPRRAGAAMPALVAALEAARENIARERDLLIECETLPPRHDPATMDPEAEQFLAPLDALLVQIDAALAAARADAGKDGEHA